MNTKDVYKIANRCACYGDGLFSSKTCNNTVVCCDMHIIALEMILRGEY